MKRLFQNLLIVASLCGLFSQGAFAQMPGTFSPLAGVAGAAGVLDCIGGTVTYSGGNTIHTFTNVGTNDFLCSTARTVNYLAVAGGGGSGGTNYSGGGGAGGMLTGTVAIPIGTSIVTVGAGGPGGAARGSNGGNSSIATPGGAGSFATVIPTQTIAVLGSGFASNEVRTRYNTPLYSATAPNTATQIRVTIGNGAAGANVLNAMYCGHAGASGTSLNYDGNQVQIKFGGNANATVPASGSPLVSDAANFSFDKTKDIICAGNWGSNAVVGNQSAGANVLGSYGPGTGAGNTTFASAGTAASTYGPPLLQLEALTTFTTVANAVGGGGGGSYSSAQNASSGGSGGGGAYGATVVATGTAGQGNNGGICATCPSGGGGAGAVGQNGTPPNGGNGGAGLASSISGVSVTYAGGGGGGGYTGTGGTGGVGGGGNGQGTTPTACTNGAANTGGGAGGISSGTSCNGGSGIVIISYSSGVPNVNCVGGTITTVGANTVHTFTSSGAISCVTGKSINYLIVAGGGWGGTTAGSSSGAGGGAGGVLTGSGIYLSSGSTLVAVGAGAPTPPATYSSCTVGTGSPSSITGIASALGGGNGGCSSQASSNGGSGGGASYTAAIGTGTAGQGNSGGLGNSGTTAGTAASGGGGGCSAVGGAASTSTSVAGNGGAGCNSSITGASVCRGGGGGGGITGTGTVGSATCGGGTGGAQGTAATPGAANTGGGGGGAGSAVSTAATGTFGGSGIVIASYATGSTQPPPPGTWKALIPAQTPTSLGTGWANYQLRNRYLTSLYLAPVATSGNTQIRVTVTGGGATGNSINQLWCGHPAAANPSMDFDGNQVQLRFSGNANVSLPTGTVVSDAVNFPFDKTKDLICSIWNGGNTIVSMNPSSAGINAGNAAGAGSNAGNSVAGFNVSNTSYDWFTTLIEVFGP